MLKRKKNNAVAQFAIDPGAYRTRFCSPAAGLLLDQPSIAVLDMDHPTGGSKAANSFGDHADELISHGLDGLRSIQPVQSDRHNQVGMSAKMLSYFLAHARQAKLTTRSPEITLMLPHNSSLKTREGFQQACRKAGAHKITILDTALAAFYATGLDQNKPCVMIDFGATETRMFAIVEGQIEHYQSIPVGGDTLDQAIAAGLLERFSLNVSEKSAREIKHCIAAATPQSIVQCTRKSCTVDCLSVKTNASTTFRVGSDTINEILQPTLNTLHTGIAATFNSFAESLRDAAYDTGIHICGGGALLPRTDQLVMDATDLPVEVVRRPINSNIRGAASTILDYTDILEPNDLIALVE